MENVLDVLSRLITARPYVTILVVILLTVLMGAGATRREMPAESEAFLPPESDVSRVMAEIDEFFGDSGEVIVATLVFRGEALTPDGLAQMDALLAKIADDPGVTDLLAPANAVIAPALLIKQALQADSLASITQEQIESARSLPQIQEALDAMTGTDTDGSPVAIANVHLRDTGDEQVEEAQRRIHQLAIEDEGPLQVSTISPIVVEDEYKRATEEGMLPLVGVALLLIMALLLVFMRTFSDLLLTFLGLILSLIWVIGLEGWFGPSALGLIGPPSSLTMMIPVIVISLTVDYAIQSVSHYREQRAAGGPVLEAVRRGLRTVTVPLVLAAVTTIVSLLAGLISPIGVIGDFGVVAGLGVGSSLIVMLTLLPAGWLIIDRRREARGTLKPPRLVMNALPGIGRVAALMGASVTRRPAPYFVVVIALTVWLGYNATRLESEFTIREILPRDGSVMADMETLDSAVGGSTEVASVLVKGEATETRTFLNVRDLTNAFEDKERRPQAAAGPIQSSYEMIVRDWIHDSGEPGDKYDPELAALYREATAGAEFDAELMQELLDRIQAQDPALARILVNNPDGIDAMLLQFPMHIGNPEGAKAVQEEVEALWLGDDNAITATSLDIVLVNITDEITARQTEAIGATVTVALTVLAIFFWVTARQPALSIIAVGPIVIAVIWVLGTMALLGIPYTNVTSLITALAIGIGVDYTIHMIHRYREEYSRSRNPEQAATETLATTGSALLGSALTTALGLGVLVAAPLAASQQFGITAAITIAYSLLVSILVVPPAMTIWGAFQNMRLRSMIKREWDELDVAIENIHQRQSA